MTEHGSKRSDRTSIRNAADIANLETRLDADGIEIQEYCEPIPTPLMEEVRSDFVWTFFDCYLGT